MSYSSKSVSIFFGLAAIMSWFWPGFNGSLFSASEVSVGDGHIIGAVFSVGSALLWFNQPMVQK